MPGETEYMQEDSVMNDTASPKHDQEPGSTAEEERPLAKDELEQAVGGMMPHVIDDPNRPGRKTSCICPDGQHATQWHGQW